MPLHLEIVTPERLAYSDEVDSVQVPGSEGELGILPHHTKWAVLFQNLRYVIIDELHAYRGVFGSHVANVVRRLASGDVTAAVLIRPTGIDEIRRTATERLLMPPKSTFFTPKLRTGPVLRPLD